MLRLSNSGFFVDNSFYCVIMRATNARCKGELGMKDCIIRSKEKTAEIAVTMLGFDNLCGVLSSAKGAAKAEKPVPSDEALKCAGVFCGYTGHCQ